MLVCPSCRATLSGDFACPQCGTHWPASGGIVDFARGAYYDHFDASTVLTDEHRAGLALEMDGARRRILDYYLPKLPKNTQRVLDCGCGNGVSVDLLNDAGYEAWGNDLSALRKWQWQERKRRDRLVVASALELPFPDDYFDAVISSGVIEHIGVSETAVPRYSVTALPDQRALRTQFFNELLRVLKPNGVLFVDCPNGAFPIDFWHSDAPGRPRFHSTREPFLPSFREIRSYAPNAEALSPYKRLQFHQAARHWYGKLLGVPMSVYFRLMPRFIAASALNPFLVVRITKSHHEPDRAQ